MPESRFAPEGFVTAFHPARRAHPDSSRAVVVLPLVAETSVTPRGSSAPSSASASGLSRSRSLPGRLVPPPRPRRRESRPAARARVSEGAATPGS